MGMLSGLWGPGSQVGSGPRAGRAEGLDGRLLLVVAEGEAAVTLHLADADMACRFTVRQGRWQGH